MTLISKSFAKRAMMVLAVLLTAMTAQAADNSGDGVEAPKFITDVMVVGTQGKSNIESLISQYEDQGWTVIKKDLNAGCGSGSDYIYLFYKSEENNDGLNHGYITDFYIHGSGDKDYTDELTSQGRTYKLVTYKGGDNFVKSKGDLNRAADGDFIHLYYTKDPMNEQAVSEIVFDNSESGALGNQGGSAAYDLNNGVENATKKIFMHLKKENATTVKYISYTYDTSNGLQSETKICGKFNLLTSNDKSWASGWYLVSGNVEISDRIKVSGTVNLILLDGCTLEAKKGIELTKGNTLNIYAQSEGANAGTLKAIATNEEECAGIGGKGSGGDVTIYGGTVEARGGQHAAGIGGGYEGSGGTVTIYGGTVEARGGERGAGIGGGLRGSGGTVTIYGGTVEAHGGTAAAGIGVGFNSAGGDVTIYGGTVEAHGGMNAAGIGGGYDCNGITVSIYGGKVVAYGDYLSTGIGAGRGGNDNGTLKIGEGLNVYDIDNPGTPLATGPQENVVSRSRYMAVGKMLPVSYLKYSYNEDSKTLTSEKRCCDDYTVVTSSTKNWSNGWYLLDSSQNFDNRISVSGTVNLILCDGCTLEAKKGIDVAKGNTLNIFAQSEGANAGTLKAIATNEEFCAGIGGGYEGSGGTVTIYGGTVEAHGGDGGAGIGGGESGAGGTVTIYGGIVEAHGGEYSAGIGGGFGGSGGTVTIYGGTVEAHGGFDGAGIGVGYLGAGGEVIIYGGMVEANGGNLAAGIGGGYTCAGVTVSIYGGMVEAHGGNLAAGIGAGRLSDSHGTLKIDDGVKVYGGNSENPTTVIATGPKNNVGSRPRYMIVGGNIKGDANDDLKVNAADLVEMVNAKDNKASDRFVLKNADIDGSGNITKSDIDGVEKIIMQK